MNKKKMLAALLMSLSAVLLTLAAPATTAYEGYYLFLGDYPHEANPGWHEEAQGVAHDRDNWFITQGSPGSSFLWKIPVTHDLRSVSPSAPGVRRISIGSVPQLVNARYNDFGDLECYEFEGQGYVFVSLEDSSFRVLSAVGVFKADTLEFVDFEVVRHGGEEHAPWAALDPTGNVYTSNCLGVSAITKNSVDWRALKDRGELALTPQPAVSLLDEQGNPLTLSHCVQGGVISPSGQLLYLVVDGIHVFDLSTRRRVMRSRKGVYPFNYNYDDSFGTAEEPEGVTIWDLDDGRAPGIRGQLHVLLLDNDGTNADDVYLKHYTGTICVDRNYTGAEKGTPSEPFNTVGEAINFYPVWDGAQIKIRAGSYPETLTFSKRVRVLSEGGTAAVGH